MNWRTLISDDGKNLSIGRTTLWLFTLMILYKYGVEGKDIPANLNTIYVSLLGYNLLKKPLPAIQQLIDKKMQSGGK